MIQNQSASVPSEESSIVHEPFEGGDPSPLTNQSINMGNPPITVVPTQVSELTQMNQENVEGDSNAPGDQDQKIIIHNLEQKLAPAQESSLIETKCKKKQNFPALKLRQELIKYLLNFWQRFSRIFQVFLSQKQQRREPKPEVKTTDADQMDSLNQSGIQKIEKLFNNVIEVIFQINTGTKQTETIKINIRFLIYWEIWVKKSKSQLENEKKQGEVSKTQNNQDKEMAENQKRDTPKVQCLNRYIPEIENQLLNLDDYSSSQQETCEPRVDCYEDPPRQLMQERKNSSEFENNDQNQAGQEQYFLFNCFNCQIFDLGKQ
ncbi:unnamed protein product (macronuclear) [Paramecium tetraurelia]|uniref:Uncharacterized protein n=1 Tax=Paramecium tetraurelia TaxID=5888 RepID=A0BFE6_PARTE|nr:uncharacterized protein GSPATT00028298001 [Paramecium tetraurelia]CAK57263.1 unnamed protein product [Paramecium tetraurelia]|eukprot:XP_001424661.1 hypothetical protein (macronuclear) [Paramecium tetraurelia strain d4-2]